MIARLPAKEPVLTRWSIDVRDYLGSETLRGISGDAEMLFIRLALDQWEHGYARADEEFWRSAHAHRIADWSRAWRQACALFTSSVEGLRNERVARDRERCLNEIRAKSEAAHSTNKKRRGGTAKADRDAQRALSGRSPVADPSLTCPSDSGSDSVSESPPTPPHGERVTSLFGADTKPPSKAETRRAGRKRKIDPATFPLPAAIDTPAVRDALVRFLRNRKGGVWNETLATDQLAVMARWGPERAVAALEASFGAQGVFEPRGASSATPRSVGGNGTVAAGPSRKYAELT